MAIDARNRGGREIEIDIGLVLGPAGQATPVRLSIGPHGLAIRAKGRRLRLYAAWETVIARMTPPVQAPAKFLSNPMGLLMEGR